MAESWLPIPGFEGQYEVSDAGAVRSLERVLTNRNGHQRTIRQRILKPCVDKHGYPRVGLAGLPGRLVHHLVLAAAACLNRRPPHPHRKRVLK